MKHFFADTIASLLTHALYSIMHLQLIEHTFLLKLWIKRIFKTLQSDLCPRV